VKSISFALPTLNRGGAERVLVTLARKLAGNGFDVSIVVLRGSGALRSDVPPAVRVVVLGAARSSTCVPELARAFRSLSPDLVVSTTHHMNVATTVAARLAEVDNIALRCPNTPSTEGDLGWLTYLSARWAYRQSRHIIAQTEEMKMDLVAQFGVDPLKVKVLLNPVDTELIDERLASAVNPYEREMINIATAGRLSKQKGIDILIKSFASVVARNSRFRLHVLGRDGGEAQSLRTLTCNLALRDHVVFWGEQNNPYPFLKFCDLFVLASRWEGLPNVLLECIYLQTRIVATRTVPILDRLIQHGENGFLVPVGDESALTEAILGYKTLVAPHRPLNSQDVVSFFQDLASKRGH
jgi:glycosyltransferase involved in cell wall biosynthesis